jgi:hypothetical protein
MFARFWLGAVISWGGYLVGTLLVVETKKTKNERRENRII